MQKLEVKNLTTIIDYSPDEIRQLQGFGQLLVAMLHVALEKPSNRGWLEELHAKQAKKWKQYYPEK